MTAATHGTPNASGVNRHAPWEVTPGMLTEGQRHCLQDLAQALELERDGEVDR